MIWFQKYSTDEVQGWCKDTMVTALDIEITKIEHDTLFGVMPVADKVRQPYGIVHGGANCVLAETLGSIAANMTVNPKTHHAVGLNISTSHIKAVRNGNVYGQAKNLHLGKTTQVWEIKTFNEAGDLTSNSSLTMMVVPRLNN